MNMVIASACTRLAGQDQVGGLFGIMESMENLGRSGLACSILCMHFNEITLFMYTYMMLPLYVCMYVQYMY